MTTLEVTVADARTVARGIRQFTLAGVLPPADPGAHVVVHTPAGPRRAYSITERTGAGEYVLAVARDDDGDGGSVSMHDDVHAGDRLVIAPPHNAFALVDAPSYLFIAGGIGITPIRAMHRAVADRARLVYLHRDRDGAAYAAEFEAVPGVTLHESTTAGRYDLWPLLRDPETPAHVYCCASTALIEEVRALTMHWDPAQIHFEDFAGVEATGGLPFTARWEPDGRSVDVGGDETLLRALRRAGVDVESSCESGTCGTCVLRLVDGEVEHRDLVLDGAERSERIITCVSRGDGTVTLAPA